MASSTSDVTRPPLKPAPTQQQESRVNQIDLDDEAHHRELASLYESYAADNADNAQGPKWAAEAAKQKRIALTLRKELNALAYNRELMEHERQMAGLGRRAAH